MTKAELLQDLSSRVVRLIEVVEEIDTKKNAVGIKQYMANVLNLERGAARGQNIGFYVVDEGTETEAAFYRDSAGSRTALEAEAVAYLATLPYVKVHVEDVDTTNEFIIVKAIADNGDGTVSEKKVMVYKDGDTPTHKEVV